MEEGTHKKRVRVSVACQTCRNRKSRCDGRHPACKRCEELGIDCQYDQPVVDRMHHRSNTGSRFLSRLHALEAKVQYLPEASPSIENSSNHDKDLHTEAFTSLEEDPMTKGTRPPPSMNGHPISPPDGMGEVQIEDTGDEGTYFGGSSNVALIRQLSITLAQAQHLQQGGISGELSQFSFNFWSHNPMPQVRRNLLYGRKQQYAAFGSASQPAINHQLLCEPETSNRLHAYFNTLGLFFPCIHQDSFLSTYKEMKKKGFVKARRSWLALLYIMIASVYDSESPASPSDLAARASVIYFTKAMDLAMPEAFFSSNLETVQLLCLMTCYLQGSSDSSQLWTIHAMSVKAAMQIGLHSVHASKDLSLLEREMRKRTWFWCCINDSSISVKLGRPPAVSRSLTKLVSPVDIGDVFPTLSASREVIATSVSAYRVGIDLALLVSDILTKLYGDNATMPDNLNVFETLRLGLDFSWKLSEWKTSVPEDFSPTTSITNPPAKILSIQTQRFRVVLSLRYYAAHALLLRPALLKFLSVEPFSIEVTEQTGFLRDLGLPALRKCVQTSSECIALAQTIVDEWQDRRVLLSGAWWMTASCAFNASLMLFGTLLVLSKPAFLSMLSRDEVATIRSSIKTASSVLSHYTDALVIARCHDILQNFLNLYDAMDASRTRVAVPDPHMLAIDIPDGTEQNVPEFPFLHDASYEFSYFDLDSFTGSLASGFAGPDWEFLNGV